MLAWLFDSFMGWLFRKQIEIAARATIAGAAAASRMTSASGTAHLSKTNKSEEAENARLAGCREVVLQYAQALGVIARECISRDELATLIDNGIRPRSWDRPLYAFRGGLRGAGASSTASKIAANIERGF
jgi:hypothetical protein